MGYATVDEYLARLPHGLASYPEACCKGMIWQQFIGDGPLPAEAEKRLPPELVVQMKKSHTSTAWLPEVHLVAGILAHCEERKVSEDDYVALALDLNRKMLAQPLARLLLLVISPTHLRDNITGRWLLFHQGTEVVSAPRSRTDGTLTLRFPPHLFPRLLLRCFGTGFRSAIEGAGGKSVRADLLDSSETHATYQLNWTR